MHPWGQNVLEATVQALTTNSGQIGMDGQCRVNNGTLLMLSLTSRSKRLLQCWFFKCWISSHGPKDSTTARNFRPIADGKLRLIVYCVKISVLVQGYNRDRVKETSLLDQEDTVVCPPYFFFLFFTFFPLFWIEDQLFSQLGLSSKMGEKIISLSFLRK